jgi:cell division protein FtsI (penicillin-binding protein 3)
MGEKALYELFLQLGFGQPTGVELPSEASGVLPPLKFWSNKVYLATHSYGHGFSLSIIQLVQAYSLFANNGAIVQPHIVRYVVDDRGERLACFSPDACGRPVARREVVRDPQAVQESLRMMRKVVTSGTGTRASLDRDGYSVAGKTGTAEKLVQGVEGYSEHHNRVTFIGLIPAETPRVIIAVMMDDPEGDMQDIQEGVDEVLRKDAGYVAAPVFAEIARMVVRRLGILPDLERAAPAVQQAHPARHAQRLPAQGPYFPPLPLPRKLAMPDLRGRPLAEVLDIMAENGMNCSIAGHGVVVSQTPEPGGPFAGCRLELAPVSSTLPSLALPIEENSNAH